MCTEKHARREKNSFSVFGDLRCSVSVWMFCVLPGGSKRGVEIEEGTKGSENRPRAVIYESRKPRGGGGREPPGTHPGLNVSVDPGPTARCVSPGVGPTRGTPLEL